MAGANVCAQLRSEEKYGADGRFIRWKFNPVSARTGNTSPGCSRYVGLPTYVFTQRE